MCEVTVCVQTDRRMGGERSLNRQSVGTRYDPREVRPCENYKICSKEFKLLVCLCEGVWVPVTTVWPIVEGGCEYIK